MRISPMKFLLILTAAFLLAFAPVRFHDLSVTYTHAHAGDSGGDGADAHKEDRRKKKEARRRGDEKHGEKDDEDRDRGDAGRHHGDAGNDG
ncbi:MAG: hypothetical protein Q9M29_03055, partial [Mariprofundaceae bacterium]|nr:hypothetical protein [Mariprofundaceae bacterium]